MDSGLPRYSDGSQTVVLSAILSLLCVVVTRIPKRDSEDLGLEDLDHLLTIVHGKILSKGCHRPIRQKVGPRSGKWAIGTPKMKLESVMI